MIAYWRNLPKSERWIYAILFAVIWMYLWFRAYSMPFVHDEAVTFYVYIQSDSFLPYVSALDANNHFLNSFLSWLCYKLFGSSWLALRIPSLMAFAVLFVALIRLAGRLQTRWLRIALILSLLATPYFIEFFALCRGYGLSMAFLVLSLSYIPAERDTQPFRHWSRAFACMLLALAANLTLITSLIVLC